MRLLSSRNSTFILGSRNKAIIVLRVLRKGTAYRRNRYETRRGNLLIKLPLTKTLDWFHSAIWTRGICRVESAAHKSSQSSARSLSSVAVADKRWKFRQDAVSSQSVRRIRGGVGDSRELAAGSHAITLLYLTLTFCLPSKR